MALGTDVKDESEFRRCDGNYVFTQNIGIVYTLTLENNQRHKRKGNEPKPASSVTGIYLIHDMISN